MVAVNRLVEYSTHIDNINVTGGYANDVVNACDAAHAYIENKGLPEQLKSLPSLNIIIKNTESHRRRRGRPAFENVDVRGEPTGHGLEPSIRNRRGTEKTLMPRVSAISEDPLTERPKQRKETPATPSAMERENGEEAVNGVVSRDQLKQEDVLVPDLEPMSSDN